VNVLTRINITKIDYLKAALMFWPLIAYAPFFFTHWVNPALRIGFFLLVSIYLFFSTKRYSKNDLFLFGLLMLLSITLVTRNSAGTVGLISAGNYCLTLFFGWGLYRFLTANSRRAYILLELYVKFFYLVIICSILSLFYFVTLGELDLFGFKFNLASHLVTPFGVLFTREFGPVTVYRSFFYFVEPVHLAIFYAANIIIVAPLLENRARTFVKVNFLGGLLSMSMAFYVVLFMLYGFKKIKSIYGFIFVLAGAFCFIYFIQIMDILSYSSFIDRFERYLLFYIAMDQANITQLLFGHGVFYDTGFDKAFNSGFTLSIYETGIVGTALQMIILFILSPSFIIFVFFLLAASVVDPIHMPLFWFLIIISMHVLKDKTAKSKILYGK